MQLLQLAEQQRLILELQLSKAAVCCRVAVPGEAGEHRGCNAAPATQQAAMPDDAEDIQNLMEMLCCT